MSAPRSYSPFPGPHYGERVLVRFCNISGAQNLSGCLNSLRATGPWVCKNCRRCGSISAPGFAEPTVLGPLTAGGPRASPTQTRKASLKPVGEGLDPSAGRTGPYEIETASGYAVGAATYGRPFWKFPPPPCRARRPRRAAGGSLHLPVGPGFPDAPPPPHNLSPTRPKGALPTNRSTARRLPDTQRQRS